MRFCMSLVMLLGMTLAHGVDMAMPNRHWVASWTGSVHGPYPIGNPSADCVIAPSARKKRRPRRRFVDAGAARHGWRA